MKGILKRTALLLFVLAPGMLFAQVNFRSVSCKVVIEGTSTLHDWSMTSSGGVATVGITLDEAGKPNAISNLSFTMAPTSLKSEHESMDNNAYKALNTKTYGVIKFTATFGTVTPAGGANYKVVCPGVLTIAGKSLSTDLVATLTLNADGSFSVSGLKAIKMTEYGVKPPSFMMGTITTGDALKIKFQTLLKK